MPLEANSVSRTPISGPSQSVCAWRSAMAMSTSLPIDPSSGPRNARTPGTGLSTWTQQAPHDQPAEGVDHGDQPQKLEHGRQPEPVSHHPACRPGQGELNDSEK